MTIIYISMTIILFLVKDSHVETANGSIIADVCQNAWLL